MSDEAVMGGRTPIVTEMEPGTYFWCACGHSKKQPFCDGSHSVCGIRPQKIEITEKKKVAWCTCKASKNGAFCDGSHAQLKDKWEQQQGSK